MGDKRIRIEVCDECAARFKNGDNTLCSECMPESGWDKTRKFLYKHRGKLIFAGGVVVGAVATALLNKSDDGDDGDDNGDVSYSLYEGSYYDSLNVYDTADNWASSGYDEDSMYGYTEDELRDALDDW